MMKILICLQIYVLVFLFQSIQSCYIWGTDSGTCTQDTLDPIWRLQNMPYCAKYVKYASCLPKYQTLPPTREFPYGRWFNQTVVTKDQWVEKNAELHIQERIAIETNRSLQRKSENEYGDKGRVAKRFYRNIDCQDAYRAFFCYTNFPRCDPLRDLTYPTCRSACENYFKSCRYNRGLYRCGKSKYFNGYEPEIPTLDADGNPVYLRDYFPGQPFRKNKYTKGGSEIGFCTPSVTGSAEKSNIWNTMLILVSSVVSTILFVCY